jgi:3-mercaptopyruvate sulfurtransferase SseA
LEEEFGFKPELLKVLKGGINAWKGADFPIETGTAVEPKGKRFTQWGRIKTKE